MSKKRIEDELLEALRTQFNFLGKEKISAKTALRIVEDTFKVLTVPIEIEEAQNYIRRCESDMGFMGSPEYGVQQKIVKDYFDDVEKRGY